MNPLVGENNLLGNAPVTKISIGICVAIALISVTGYLPNFAPYFILSLSSFSFPLPKVWVLLTSTFYCSTFLSAILSGVLVIFLGKAVEPIIGSKEFLRLFVMIGFFTNCLMLLLAFAVYAATRNPLLFIRPYESHGATTTAILMSMAHVFLPVEMPTACCVVKVRLLPFYSFCVSVVMALFSQPDDLIATVIGTVLSFVYIRYIKKKGNERGDPEFTMGRLVPSFGAPEEEVGGRPDPDEEREIDERMAGMAGVPPDAMEGERRNFRLDGGEGAARPAQGRDPFQGQPRRLGQ
jgi:membrane associated rhomboid family serine protease